MMMNKQAANFVWESYKFSQVFHKRQKSRRLASETQSLLARDSSLNSEESKHDQEVSLEPATADSIRQERDFAEITGELNVLSLSKAVREVRIAGGAYGQERSICDVPAHEQLVSLQHAGVDRFSARKASCQCSKHASTRDFCSRRIQILKDATVIGAQEIECLDILRGLIKRMISQQQHSDAAAFVHAAVDRICILPAQDRVGHGKALLFGAELMEMIGHYQSAASFYKAAYRFFVKELGERHCLTERAGCRHLQILREVGWESSLQKVEKACVKVCKCSNAPFYVLDLHQLLG